MKHTNNPVIDIQLGIRNFEIKKIDFKELNGKNRRSTIQTIMKVIKVSIVFSEKTQ